MRSMLVEDQPRLPMFPSSSLEKDNLLVKFHLQQGTQMVLRQISSLTCSQGDPSEEFVEPGWLASCTLFVANMGLYGTVILHVCIV